MNMQAIQMNQTANAAMDSAAKGRVAESGDGETSFRDVLKGEVAERKQAETDEQPIAGKVDKAASKDQATAASESVKAISERDKAESTAVATNPEDMTRFLVLTSQFVQPAVAGEVAAIAGVAFDAAAVMSADPAIAQEGAELPLSVPQQAFAAQSQSQTDMKAKPALKGKPDFAAQFDQARMAQQPISGAASDKAMQQSGVVAEALAAAAQATETASDVQQPATTFVALQQAAIDQAEKLTDPSANRIAPRVATPAWNQAVGHKIVWMAGNEQQVASLTLNPPDLGPLQVVIRVSESIATANFVSAHPEVRQALEAAMPRLREMLGEAGIQLGQAHVGAGTSGEYGARAQQQLAQPAFGIIETSFTLQQDMPQPVQVIRRGLIDTFA